MVLIQIFWNGSLFGCVNSNDIISNCFCYESDGVSAIGLDKRTGKDGYTISDDITGIANLLGEKFKEDTNEINQGYPILSWQEEK